MSRFICLTAKGSTGTYVYIDKDSIRTILSMLEYGTRYSKISFKNDEDNYVEVREEAQDIIAELEGAPKPRCTSCGEKPYGAKINSVWINKDNTYRDLCSSCEWLVDHAGT
jgi:hypothetical protein